MITDLDKIMKFGAFVSKNYAPDFFRLLNAYQDISASEAASRLNLHIQTAQDFLEAMTELEVLSREEKTERKRPYYRYTLKTTQVDLMLNLEALSENKPSNNEEELAIREVKNAGAQFSVARGGNYFSSITLKLGKGRTGKLQRINLTQAQGQFLFHLPFPDALPLKVSEIIKRAGIDPVYTAEINDIILALIEQKVIAKN